MPQFATAADAERHNMQFRCTAPGCTEHRVGLSQYCARHRGIAQKYGDPRGTSVVRQNGSPLYQRELNFTHELLIKNFSSAPVQAALNILGQWFNAAKHGMARVPGDRLFKRVEDVESVALPILEDITACYIYCLETKNKGDNELTFALSIALFRHIPREYRTAYSSRTGTPYQVPMVRMRKTEREAIGNYIRNELGVFLDNVHKHWSTNTQRKRDLKQDLIQPIRLGINTK